jgi:hypothetical protein
MLVGIKLGGLWGFLLMPVVVVVVFAKVLDLSYLGAFVLCILAAAIQVVVSKVFATLFGG